MSLNTFGGFHGRLVSRVSRHWAGRISDVAANDLMKMYESMFLAYLSVILLLTAFMVSVSCGWPLLGYGFIAAAFVSGGCLFAYAWTSGRAAGIDIAREYGLPESMWRKIKVKTPERFDQWLATQGVAKEKQGRRTDPP
jgi:hypothetical protein